MSTINNLNENEKAILNLLYKETMNCTGGEFGYMEDVARTSFTKHQFAGYISSLQTKGIFEYLDGQFHGQFALKPEIIEQLTTKGA